MGALNDKIKELERLKAEAEATLEDTKNLNKIIEFAEDPKNKISEGAAKLTKLLLKSAIDCIEETGQSINEFVKGMVAANQQSSQSSQNAGQPPSPPVDKSLKAALNKPTRAQMRAQMIEFSKKYQYLNMQTVKVDGLGKTPKEGIVTRLNFPKIIVTLKENGQEISVDPDKIIGA